MYEYLCKITNVVDGDTVDVDIDLGLGIHAMERVRLYGINAPEHNAPGGKEATEFLRGIVAQSERWILRTFKDQKEKYGRYLGEFRVSADSKSISEQMVAGGHAVEYFGGKR